METAGIYGADGRRSGRIGRPLVKGRTEGEGMFSFEDRHLPSKIANR